MAETAAAPAPAAPAKSAPPPPRALRRDEILMVAGGSLLLVTVAFFVLGRMYYIDKLSGSFIASEAGDPDAAAAAAAWDAIKATYFWGFFTFSTIGTLAITAAVLWPRLVAHSLSTGFGVLCLVSAVFIFRSHMPVQVGVFQAAIGALMLRLTWASWRGKDRAAWAFLLSLAGVLSVALLFGAPRIRAAMNVPRLWFVMLIPAVMAALAVALHRARTDYD